MRRYREGPRAQGRSYRVGWDAQLSLRIAS